MLFMLLLAARLALVLLLLNGCEIVKEEFLLCHTSLSPISLSWPPTPTVGAEVDLSCKLWE